MKTSMNTVLALAMKEIRTTQGYNQKAMADLLGMTNAGWGKVENGLTTISVEMLFRFGKLVNMPPSHILVKVEETIKLLEKEGFEFTAASTDEDSLLQGYSWSKAVGSGVAAFALPFKVDVELGIVSSAATLAKNMGKFFK